MNKDNNRREDNSGSSSAASAFGTVVGAGAGAGMGVVIGELITPETASASDSVEATLAEAPAVGDQNKAAADETAHVVNNTHINSSTSTVNIYNQNPEEPAQPTRPVEPVDPSGEVEVLSFQRVTDPDTGGVMDMAVVIEDGAEVAYVDVNIDGMADLRIQDINNNGSIEFDSEAQDITGQHISMEPFREAFEGQPDFNSNNDMADYVNNADVDNFMA